MGNADDAVLGDGEDMRGGAIHTASSLDSEQDKDNITNVEGSFEPNTGDGNPSQMAKYRGLR